MAKTLIGNIKGEDGRGIVSIEKTGTTSSVDTYTITYTDSTTSTFTINNPDSISLQRQIVPSAAVESSDTASQAYAAGDYVVVNGVLRKVESAIAKGNAISDSNSTATTATGEIKTVQDSVSRKSYSVSSSEPRISVDTCIEAAGFVFMAGRINAYEAGFLSATLTGCPKAKCNSGVVFCRNSVWKAPVMSGTLWSNGDMLVQVTEAVSDNEEWSVMYLSA